MKKRLAAIVMSTMMAVSALTVPTIAEEAATESASSEPITVTWEDVSAQSPELVDSGSFVTFDEIAITLWVPDVLPATELTDEDRDAGYIGYYATTDQAAAIAVQYVDVSGMTLDQYKEVLAANGVDEILDVVVNGLEGVSYDLKDQDTSCVAFTTQLGYIIEVSGAPTSDEGFNPLLSLTFASIQDSSDAAEAEADTE